MTAVAVNAVQDIAHSIFLVRRIARRCIDKCRAVAVRCFGLISDLSDLTFRSIRAFLIVPPEAGVCRNTECFVRLRFHLSAQAETVTD